MSFTVEHDDSVQGLDLLVVSLEEYSRQMDEVAVTRDVSPADEIQLTGWVERPRNGSCKLAGRRSTPSISKHFKEQRSSPPRRVVSRQLATNREDSMGFKHYLDMRRYIEQYRNDKVLRQQAALKELLLSRNERYRASGSCQDCGRSADHSEHFTIKQAPSVNVVSMKEVPSAQDDNETKPFIVVSSKGPVRPSNLPVSGHFQSRKLQNRPTARDRRINQLRGTQWSKAHNDVSLEITSCGNSDASHTLNSSRQDEDYSQTLIERRPSGNLTAKRSELSPSPTSPELDIRSVIQTCHAIPQKNSAVEKCDAWVKSRNHNLETVKGSKDCGHREQVKAHPLRTLPSPVVSSQLVMRGNTLHSSQKDSLSVRTSESSTNVTSSSSLSGMDYSQYTDMFKNVLEFYGTKRLRPKSQSAVEQLLSIKS